MTRYLLVLLTIAATFSAAIAAVRDAQVNVYTSKGVNISIIVTVR